MPLISTKSSVMGSQEEINVHPIKSTKSGLPRDVMLMTNKWNEKYTQELADKGPGSLRSMNRGVSHLVAPLSYLTNPTVKKICETQNKFLHSRNEEIIKYHDPMYGKVIEKSSDFNDSPVIVKKKHPSLTKTLKLKKLYEAN